jgi:hypothetical protein
MTPVVITITFKQQAQWKETRTKPEGEKTTGVNPLAQLAIALIMH